MTVETDSFPQGAPIYVSFEVKNVPSKSQVRVVWSDSSKRKISEEEKQAGSGGAVSFQIKEYANLAMGDYLVEFFYGEPGTPVRWMWLGSKNFRVALK